MEQKGAIVDESVSRVDLPLPRLTRDDTCDDELFGHTLVAVHSGYGITTWNDQPALLRVQRCPQCGRYGIERFDRTTLAPLHPQRYVTELTADIAAIVLGRSD